MMIYSNDTSSHSGAASGIVFLDTESKSRSPVTQHTSTEFRAGTKSISLKVVYNNQHNTTHKEGERRSSIKETKFQ